MSRFFTHILRIVIFAALLLSVNKGAFAFDIPERLEFKISYAGVTAGYATQEITKNGNNLYIVSTAHSADWLKLFFPVNDRIESVVAKNENSLSKIGLPLSYKERIHEGPTNYRKDVEFDYAKLEVVTKDLIKNNSIVNKMTEQTYDTLSSFYYYRTVPLQVGTSSFINIYDCKRLWNTEVQVLRKEKLKTDLGQFNTVVIKPVLMNSEGVFASTGDMYIWLTDDERRIPVQMKSKMKVGSITATLVGGSYWPEKKR